MKQCSACKQTKDASEFCKRSTSEDGLQYACRNCCDVYVRKWQKENPEKVAKIAKKYYTGHKKKRFTENKRWLEKNPKYMAEYNRAWRKKNPAKVKKFCAKRNRNLSWVLLYPNPFSEYEKINGHHVNNTQVVYLPADLHQLYNGTNTENHRANLSYIVDQFYGDDN